MRWIATIVTVVLLVATGWTLHAASQDALVRQAAGTLSVPDDWLMTSDSFRPSHLICASGRCPESTRSFHAKDATPRAISHVLERSGWQVTFDAPCEPAMTSTPAACSASGTAYGVPVSLYIFGIHNDPGAASVTIHVG